MELDEIKEHWTQSNRRLEASMRLNVMLFAQQNLNRADTSLKRLSRKIGFELLLNVVAVALLGAFAANHAGAPRLLVPAVMLDIYAVALVVAGVRQLAAIGSIDYDEPAVNIARQLAALRLARIRTTLWTLLFAPLMWLPLSIVGFALFGVDVYTAGWAWLAANALFGLAVIPLGISAARRYGEWFATNPSLRALGETLAGRTLASAIASVDAVRRFEADASS